MIQNLSLTADQIEILYFREVANSDEILDCIRQRNFPAAVLDGNTFLNIFQFLVAAQIATLNAFRGKLVTLDVFSEIVFCLSAGKNVREAFSTFGFQSSSKSAVVVLVNPDPNTKEFILKKFVCAEVLETNEDMAKYCNEQHLMQLYQIELQELNESTLLDAIITRIAARVAL
ncbi:hypothetical protein Gasu2_02850 [Galdieria sulphuraria]|uniref:EKC/KEOPS complex subunit CGI121 n=1 Tax=Galdieria sulphuraria TaxID=130081 RepID=M2VRQ4_GALSU|nr:uncharacterized protein Gasu_65540 [Galdieria sulphuraria]EME25786.1 hypothetical protein Gasu_65540 [Galdieria sulphuraria]GJD05836.1 hypothetical protein Gasu2_02850 [Galdieria sulphuraria]|eukprot:XP_005702306.1 hypothetical protein Gasu_65540 [Galdieria sulphuraria]